MTKAYEILSELGDKDHSQNFSSVGQAIAYLRQKENQFHRCKNQKEAQKTLEDLKRYLALRKEGLEKYLNTEKTTWKNQLSGILYLTGNQKYQILQALDHIIQKFVNLSGESLTNEDIERLKEPLPPGVISLEPSGVYTFEDLSPYVRLGDPNDDKRREDVSRWLKGSIGLALMMEHFKYSEINFPVLE